MHHIEPFPTLPAAPDGGRETAGLPRPGSRIPWRAAGIGFTSLGTPVGIGVTDPLLGHVAFAAELAVALTVAVTALFGRQALSERAFRLLRWIANRPEPPGPAALAAEIPSSSAPPRQAPARRQNLARLGRPGSPAGVHELR